MRLKKIEILGFKSFADKVVIEFHEGITGIVGPNGCGKSNISDAFRWVLGEQSAKSLRGHKMNDVIFAGTSYRKPLNFAEVTITLSDVAGQLPIEYEEISVTRRLHRSGESDYFLNRQPVRLKDIQSLFLDSGMGKDAYSIFEQGKIDQVINYTPLERRYIFEEAAGILRFLQRKREALRKLEQSDQNMVRVKDIHQEVEKQIIVLEEQAGKARVYKENKAKLEALEKAVFVGKWDNLQKRGGEIRKKHEDQSHLILETNHVLEGMQKQLQEEKINLTQQEKALRAKSEEVFKTRSDKEIKSRERQSNQERLKESLVKEKRWQQELEAIIEKRKNRHLESSTTQKQQKGIEKELASNETALKGQREKVQEMEEDVGKLRDQQQHFQQELLKLLQAESQLESDLKQNTVRLETNQDRSNRLQKDHAKLQEALQELSKSTQEKKQQVKQAAQTIDEQKEVFNALEIKLEELNAEIQEKQADIEFLQQNLTEGKARQKALFRLRDEMEGFSAGSKRLLQETANPKSSLFKKLKGLYEYLSAENDFETALSIAMRPYGQTLVVEKEADFLDVIAFATNQKLKDFSLLCLSNLEHVEKGHVKGLDPLLKYIQENEVASHLLNKVYVGEDAKTALTFIKKNTGIEIWTKEGIFVDRNGVVFYHIQAENTVFMREAELKTLEKKLQEMESTHQKQEAALKALQHRRSLVQSERLELDKCIRRDEMKLIEVNFGLQRALSDHEKAKNEEKQLDHEIRTINQAIENLMLLLGELNKKHVQANTKVSELQKSSVGLNSELEKKILTLRIEQRQLQEKESSYQKVSDENRKLLHALNVLEVKDLESLQQEERLAEEITSSQEFQEQIRKKNTQYETLLEEVDQQLTGVVSACAEIEKEVVRKKSGIEGIEKQDWTDPGAA